MKQAEAVRAVVTQRGAVLLDTERGVMFDLNDTGALLWTELPHRSPAELADLLRTRFPGIGADVLQADVQAFLAAVTARQLVVTGD
jgi:hypothetical protein